VSRSPTRIDQGPVDPQYRAGWSRITNLIETGGSWSGRERNCCYLNLGGDRPFADVSYASGFDFPDDARAVASVDWDHDGDLDLWITNRTAPRLRFLRNNGSQGQRGVLIRLQGTSGNRDAIGARLELISAEADGKPLVRFVTAGSGYLSQSSKWVHFGIGTAAGPFRLKVAWPGGSDETIEGLGAGGRYRVVEGSGKAVLQKARDIQIPAGGLAVVAPTGIARIPLLERLPLPPIEYLDTSDTPRVLVVSGRPTLVNLWATWCLPCVKELHEFKERGEELEGAGLDVVALSVDGLKDGKPAQLKVVSEFVQKHELPFGVRRATSVTVDRLDVIHDVVMTTRTQLDDKYTLPVPASFLLDASGHLAVIYKGPVSVDRLLSDVALLTDDTDIDLAIAYAGRWFLRPHGLGSVAVRVADRLVRRGHLDAAVTYAGLAADLSRRNGNPFELKHKTAAAYIDLGNAWDKQERYKDAAVAYGKAHEVDPTDAAAVTNLGNATLRLGDQQSAERYYRQAVDLNPNQFQARMNLGSICLQQQRIFEAVKHLGAAIQINPRFPQAHNMLGMAFLKQGRRSSARDQFQKAVDLDPDYEDARANLKAVSGSAAAGGGP
jgi:Flp pilus assembly protein TadD/peroxiredoxin